MSFELVQGNCLEAMKKMSSNSVHSIVTDPPYGLSFMGKKWDYDVPSIEIWEEALRVLKPGGHLLSFAGSRTYHRMAVNIEDAGFEIRDQIMWIYGSGFPKSHNIGKAMDGKIGKQSQGFSASGDDGRKAELKQNLSFRSDYGYKFEPTSDNAKQWEGWGTALKPAHEPIVVARKPLIGTIVENVLKHGAGGLNIDGCRIGTDEDLNGGAYAQNGTRRDDGWGMQRGEAGEYAQPSGRFPANIIFDEEAGAILDEQSGTTKSALRPPTGKALFASNDPNRSVKWNANNVKDTTTRGHSDFGGASRFFYCAKPSKQERNAGCEGLEAKVKYSDFGLNHRVENNIKTNKRTNEEAASTLNNHPTVKPVALMKYLCRLVTPPNGIVLDPFLGSGTTGIAATHLDFNFIGIELSEEYMEIARHRIKSHVDVKETILIEKEKQKSLFDNW